MMALPSQLAVCPIGHSDSVHIDEWIRLKGGETAVVSS